MFIQLPGKRIVSIAHLVFIDPNTDSRAEAWPYRVYFSNGMTKVCTEKDFKIITSAIAATQCPQTGGG